MHNKNNTIAALSLVAFVAAAWMFRMAYAVTPPDRQCVGIERDDVDACINGGTEPSNGQPWPSPAPDGTTIKIKAGSATWASPITVTKNVTILGNGTGSGGTTINGGLLWALRPHPGTLQPRMRLANFHFNKDRTYAEAAAMLNIRGACPINDAHSNDATQSGGVQIDHNLITASSNAVGGGFLMIFGGWPEGCVDHNVVDLSVIGTVGLPSGGVPKGEWLIINFNDKPTSTDSIFPGSGASGFTAWASPPPVNSHHLLTIEDNIFKRHGAIDSNQFAPGQAGGAMFRVRHNTIFHGVEGHGGPGDTSDVWGTRFKDVHKNLIVRGTDETAADQSAKMVNQRSGESVVWGNRMNRYGTQAATSASAFQVECAVVSSWKENDHTGGADGTNPWFENQKGHIANGTNGMTSGFDPDGGYLRDYTNPWLGPSRIIGGVDSLVSGATTIPGPSGDVYAFGAGGDMTGVHTFTLRDAGGHTITSMPTDKWKNFVVVNINAEGGKGSTGFPNVFGNPGGPTPTPPVGSPQNYAFVLGNTAGGVFSKSTTNSNDNAAPEWAIGPNTPWEIRRVKSYLNVAGRGMIDTPVDLTTNTPGQHNLRLVNGTTPTNPKWTNQPNNLGSRKWDNSFKVSANGSWIPITQWQGLAVNCQYACGEAMVDDNNPNGALSVAAGYVYTATAAGSAGPPEVRPGTRVGADAAAWAIAPSDIIALDANCPNQPGCEGVSSFYEVGSGGPPYPHPFVSGIAATPSVSVSAPTFLIGGTDDCSTNSNCAHITTSGFSTSPIVITIDAWSPSLSNVALSSTSGTGVGTIHGTASGNAATSYSTTVHADTATESATVALSINLQTGNSPPSVNLASPAPGTIYLTTDTVNLVADASDTDDGLTKVEFYDGATLLNTDTTSPYSYSTTLALGTHSLTAKAYDHSTSKTSAAVSIQVANGAATPTPPAILQIKP